MIINLFILDFFIFKIIYGSSLQKKTTIKNNDILYENEKIPESTLATNYTTLYSIKYPIVYLTKP